MGKRSHDEEPVKHPDIEELVSATLRSIAQVEGQRGFVISAGAVSAALDVASLQAAGARREAVRLLTLLYGEPSARRAPEQHDVIKILSEVLADHALEDATHSDAAQIFAWLLFGCPEKPTEGVDAREHAAKALASLAAHPAGVQVIARQGALPDLAQLASSEGPAQRWGALALRHAATDEKHRDEVIRFLPSLLAALGNGALSCASAAEALGALAEDESLRSQLFQAGAPGALKEALERPRGASPQDLHCCEALARALHVLPDEGGSSESSKDLRDAHADDATDASKSKG
ncbi:hypothetical protein AK812_SmicGene9430 [Symbiodinium microadriaticum]|uniref:Uncharacterized protein n=1 Tax=Symbiodinium microadriaticum TaxID=2951 RepID=A0A1Q9EIG8_SYMMI|nr:hypothetical protein AK812_SmicGene9430 [Symbiodinium microadriaticum]